MFGLKKIKLEMRVDILERELSSYRKLINDLRKELWSLKNPPKYPIGFDKHGKVVTDIEIRKDFLCVLDRRYIRSFEVLDKSDGTKEWMSEEQITKLVEGSKPGTITKDKV